MFHEIVVRESEPAGRSHRANGHGIYQAVSPSSGSKLSYSSKALAMAVEPSNMAGPQLPLQFGSQMNVP